MTLRNRRKHNEVLSTRFPVPVAFAREQFRW